MSRNWTYVSGQWNFICDSCGQKHKSGIAKKRWDGLTVCPECYEIRHPQDFVRPRPDKQSVPWSRPKLPEVFVPLNFTEFPVDSVTLDETVSTVADFYRYVGFIDYGMEDVDVLNGSALNTFELNHSSTDPTPPANDELVTLAESVVVSKGFNVTLSDSVTITESITEEEGEFSIDTMSISETISAFLISNKILNAHTLNEVTLG